MKRTIAWLRQFIDEPEDFSLESILAEAPDPSRASARPAERLSFARDLEDRVEAPLL